MGIVSAPDQEIKEGIKLVEVIKTYYPQTYDNKTAKDDFSIFILKEPLGDFGNANLITKSQLDEVTKQKIKMKITGYGRYEDACAGTNKKPPCNYDQLKPSLVPRSMYMTPNSWQEITAQFNIPRDPVEDHLFLTGKGKDGPCAGDSGGSTTVEINGVEFYVGTVPSGFYNGSECGHGEPWMDIVIGYTAPVYKFLDLIAEAEKYVEEHPYVAPSPAPTPAPTPTFSATQPKNSFSQTYLFIINQSKKWASQSLKTDKAMAQCVLARDKGLIKIKGKNQTLGHDSKLIRTALKSKEGFQACLDGFKR